jgi:CRISPR-associated protein Cmr6
MENKGVLIIRKNKKGETVAQVQIEGLNQPMSVPSFYDTPNESLNNKPCAVEREKGLISRITVEGYELKRKDSNQDISKKNGRRHQRSSPQQPNERSPKGESKQSSLCPLGLDLKIPSDTCGHVRDTPSNFSLALNHFIDWKNNKPSKPNLSSPSFGKDLITNIKNRNEQILRDMKGGYDFKKFSATVSWRIVVGLGVESVHETSMALHHIYGIPHIPGSALKGIARNAAVQQLCGEHEEVDVMDALVSLPDIPKLREEKKREIIKKAGEVKRKDGTKIPPKGDTVEKILKGWDEFETARKVFGGQAQAGVIIFLDAFPNGNINIRRDIMNPHYPDYYGKSDPKPPADWQNPTPITFLTVEDTKFVFCLATKEKYKEYLPPAVKWLRAALENQGVGAKTSVGYGYFQDFQ